METFTRHVQEEDKEFLEIMEKIVKISGSTRRKAPSGTSETMSRRGINRF
jgi:hypothetical protein